MKPSVQSKNGIGVKAPLAVKTGPLKRLPIKKIYCPKCRKLIKGQTKSTNNELQIICPRCSRILWTWKSISWRKCGREADVSI